MLVLKAPSSWAFSFFEPDILWNPEGKKAAVLTEMNPTDHQEIIKKLVSLPRDFILSATSRRLWKLSL